MATLFKENESVLDVYVNLKSLFQKNESVYCNYGESKVIEIYNDHILVDVPKLGKREIYDFKSIEKK